MRVQPILHLVTSPAGSRPGDICLASVAGGSHDSHDLHVVMERVLLGGFEQGKVADSRLRLSF